MAYPLGDTCQYSRGKHEVLATLPPRQLMEQILQCYFAAFEPIHRLIHPREFYYELNAFLIDPSQSSDVWLAQLCMMLALGCRAAPGHLFTGGMGRSAEDWTDSLLDAAQFFHGGSLNLLKPTLTTVRSLCLTVLARMMDIVKGTTAAQLESLMGMTIRLAMTMHLHRTTSLFPEIGAFEAEMRRRVWVTIQILDLDLAMRTGTSYICREHDADTPLNLDDADISYSKQGWTLDVVRCPSSRSSYTDSSFQIQLSGLLPLLVEIINTINSPTMQQGVEQARLSAWETQLREKLKEAEDELFIGQHVRPEMADRIAIQRQFLGVLVHRTLMAMGHESVVNTSLQANPKCQAVAQTVMDSAVLLLRTQMAWYSSAPAPPPPQGPPHYGNHLGLSQPSAHSRSRSPSPSPCIPVMAASIQSRIAMSANKPTTVKMTSWLVDLCHDDFGAAMLYLMLGLRAQAYDVDAAAIRSDERSNTSGRIPSRAEMWSILRQSLNIAGDLARQSISHFQEFMGLSIAASCLQSLETGEPVSCLLLDAAGEIERRVLLYTGGGVDRHDLDLGHVPISCGGGGINHAWVTSSAPVHNPGRRTRTTTTTTTGSVVIGIGGVHAHAQQHQQQYAPPPPDPVDFPAEMFEFGFG